MNCSSYKTLEQDSYAAANCLAALSPVVLWKVENIPNELGDLDAVRGNGAMLLKGYRLQL